LLLYAFIVRWQNLENMFEPKDLSISELKKFHKATQEKVACAKEDTSEESKMYQLINPSYNRVKAEGMMVLRMLDEELDRRGYDPEKLFKGYKCDG
jgi:hypothetical protein